PVARYTGQRGHRDPGRRRTRFGVDSAAAAGQPHAAASADRRQSERHCRAYRHVLIRLLGEQITLETKASSPLSTVNGDVAQIEQILLTLAVNARDAMPIGGQL